MDIESLREYCLSKPGTTECFPFDEDTLVFKVGNKMYALTSLSESHSVNLKCDPARAIELRESFPEIVPGYHMSKKHWNTVELNGGVNDAMVRDLIDHSYELVVASLPKAARPKN